MPVLGVEQKTWPGTGPTASAPGHGTVATPPPPQPRVDDDGGGGGPIGGALTAMRDASAQRTSPGVLQGRRQRGPPTFRPADNDLST